MTYATKMRRLAQRLEAMDPLRRIAFVFYGGGLNMAFHAGAMQYVMTTGRKGQTSTFHPTSRKAPIVIAGNGAGALVGAMYAQGFEAFQGELLPELFNLARRGSLFSGLPLFRLLARKQSLYSLDPLLTLIEKLVQVDRFIIPFMVGVLGADYANHAFTPADGSWALRRGLLASSSAPPLTPSIEIDGQRYTGGAGPLTIGDFVRLGLRRFVVFSSAADKTLGHPLRPDILSSLAHLEHTLSTLQDSIIQADLRTVGIVNDLIEVDVSEHTKQSPTLSALAKPQRLGASDRLYHHVQICVIKPEYSLRRNPYASTATIERDFELGVQRAALALRKCQWLSEYAAS